MKRIRPILLCGGTGTRLWPLSRKTLPKQFAKLFGEERSMFQRTCNRLKKSKNLEVLNPLVLTSLDYRFIVRDQLNEIGIEPLDILLEPISKNTGPSFLAGVLHLKRVNSIDDPVLFLPTDHKFEDQDGFKNMIERAITYLGPDKVITFGVKPTRPETEYGYIKVNNVQSEDLLEVSKFIEKPNKETATKFLQKDLYLWNLGIFLSNPKTIERYYSEKAQPLLAKVSKAIENTETDLGFVKIEEESWAECQSISFDHAIMEKINNIFVLRHYGNWSDMGSWEAVWRDGNKEKNGNLCIGDVIQADCNNSLLIAQKNSTLLASYGLENIVVVSMDDAVLVADKNKSGELKKLVGEIVAKKKKQAEFFLKVYRPWGFFETLIKENNFHVKIISVLPKARLSLQSHKHRAEHWVVVDGQANVTLEDEEKIIKTNQSIYIPKGNKHRLHNKSSSPLKVIEVQTGFYLEEDDIIRYDDDYSR